MAVVLSVQVFFLKGYFSFMQLIFVGNNNIVVPKLIAEIWEHDNVFNNEDET